MTDEVRKPRCVVCGLVIPQFNTPRCRRCQASVCSPYLRDCGYEHWRDRHVPHYQRVKDIKVSGEAL